MAFDPVRDAILNSPERASYANPFDEPELADGTAVTSDFKAPPGFGRSTAGHSNSGSDSQSPDRNYYKYSDVADTPGGLTIPPTPGSVPAEDGFGIQRSGTERRQSSIFNLLSPEPYEHTTHDPGNRSTNGYFDGMISNTTAEVSSSQIYDEPAQIKSEGTSKIYDSKSSLRPSLVDETTSGSTLARGSLPSLSSSPAPRQPLQPSVPILREPVKRGRPYAPFKRITGPAPPSLYIPITPEELAYYRNPANCKNPLRTGVQIAPRSPPVIRESAFRSDHKGKGRAIPMVPPDDVDIAPAYAEPSALPAALQPTPVQRRRPGLSRNSSGLSSPNKKRKRESFTSAMPVGEGVQVAAHYNKRLNYTREQRNESPIIGLKHFNNWVKSVLIAKYARDYHQQQRQIQGSENGRGANRREKPGQLRVLDLGCGKGGDLQKWQRAGVKEYIGVDIAEVSIQQARQRWEELRGRRFDASFFALDCYSHPLTSIIPQQMLTEPPFDVVTMQFCMHYAFQSVSKARMMLENVSRYLKPGGTFIGTIPDSEQLLSRLKELPEDANPLAFGNDVYRIVFDDRSKFPAFGHRYTFFLTDAVEDVPEYVVQWESFETLAAEYKLKVLYHATFHDLFGQERDNPEFEQLLLKMKVVSPEGESELTEDQWEAANIYVAFAFVKV